MLFALYMSIKLVSTSWSNTYSEPKFQHGTVYCSCDKIEKNEMGGACSAYGGQERHIRGFWWRNLRKRKHLGDPGLDGKIKILRWIFRK